MPDFEKLKEAVESISNKLCKEIPQGYEIALYLELGAATVALYDDHGDRVCLPDTADKSLTEQLLDALEVAKND